VLDSSAPAVLLPSRNRPTPAPVATRVADLRLPLVLRFRPLLGVSLVAAAVSLLFFRTPTFDVWAWLLWGREAAHLQLNTVWGPAFKPLPVAVTTVLAPFGGAAPVLWLLVARVGGLLAVAGAARLAYRWSGALGAALAAVGLLVVRQYLGYLVPQGMSEPLMVAFLLWAVDRHLAGRRETAFWLAVLGGLLRPEIWPFLLGYAVVLGRRRRPDVAEAPTPALRLRLTAGLALLPVAWYLPDFLGSGQPFRQGEGVPVPGGPLTQPHPGFAVLQQVHGDLPSWVLVGAVLGLLVALRRRNRALVVLSGLGAGWLGIVAAMAEVGRSTGVSRYVLPTYALAAVLAGVGWAGAARTATAAVRARRPVLPVVAGVCAVHLGLTSMTAWVRQFGDDLGELRYQRGLEQALPPALSAAGGAPAVAACGRPWTSMYQVPFVAWTLHEHIKDVWSLQAPGLPVEQYVGPLLQTGDRRGAPAAPVPFSFLQYRSGGSASSGGATWTVLLPADCPT
jgi:hypothetical protein